MIFKCGIIGLPNVGKSTFFNTLTSSSVKSENFPFCTINSNHGLVSMWDIRLYQLSKYIQTKHIIFGNIELIDIAGLIKGASQGAGLGNKFLNDIMGVDILCHVVRCFDKHDIYHVNNNINPKKDIKIVHDELILSDILCCEKLILSIKKRGKYCNRKQKIQDVTQILLLLDKCLIYLYDGIMLHQCIFSTTEKFFIQDFNLLTYKPMIYIANIDANDNGNDINYNSYLNEISEISSMEQVPYISMCILSESKSTNVDTGSIVSKNQLNFESFFKYSKIFDFINTIYHVLHLKTFFTINMQAVKAWITLKNTVAIQAANMVHSEFEEKFIRVQVVQYNDFIVFEGMVESKRQGKIRTEGKNYLVREGDILNFLICK